ncbi:cytoplasmic protein [Crepidotus variabilis]|uniref:Cytoplasmic protein n=1 Tax=Crepidotus variabilis TaxID=179855 RepID=A0A9P6EFN9_9AGAR|nr:cytoplasmic protein [Crepidotus variabilis]
MVAPLYTTASGLLFHAGHILVMTIGLPARGKTHISRALERYLRWTGVKTQVISLGDYRRKNLGGAQKLPPDYFTLGEKSPETIALRKKISEGCEKLIWEFFESGGQVVIYDANNGAAHVRNAVAERFDKAGIHVIMLESMCDNKEIIEANIRSVKISSPDYKNWNPDQAIEDYYKRINDHEKYYETVSDMTWPFIKIINASLHFRFVGEKIELNKIQGYLQSRIVFFLMNIHNKFRTIYFARSGQSLIEHSYKADSDLSPAGWEYAEKLKDFVLERRARSLEERGLNPRERKLVIWTSTRRRAHHTAWPFVARSGFSALSSQLPLLPVDIEDEHIRPRSPEITSEPESFLPSHSLRGDLPSPPPLKRQSIMPSQVKVIEKPQMLEINPGIWDGLTPEQAKKYYPGDWDRFTKDPYSYRVPRAESYHDLSVRIEPILIELEREQEDLLIIGHASVIRCLLAYLIGLPASEIPAIEIARGDLLEVVPASYGVHSHAFHFWDGPGRRGEGGDLQDVKDANNFYENYAESTRGKRKTNDEGEVIQELPDGPAMKGEVQMPLITQYPNQLLRL